MEEAKTCLRQGVTDVSVNAHVICPDDHQRLHARWLRICMHTRERVRMLYALMMHMHAYTRESARVICTDDSEEWPKSGAPKKETGTLMTKCRPNVEYSANLKEQKWFAQVR